MKRITPPSNRPLCRGGIKKVSTFTLYTVLLAGAAFAEDQATHDKLTGTWQRDGNGETWVLNQTGDSIHVTNSSGAETLADFDCNTLGKECAIKHSGHKSTVSMWFNGEKLVELETTGTQVVKRRFTATGSGDTMDLEIIPVAPGGNSTTVHFKRVAAVISKQ